MYDQKADNHRHPGKMQHARGLKAAEQRDQAGELYGLPDGYPGNHLRDAGENDDDVEQFLNRVVDGDVVVRDLEVQRVDNGLHHFGRTDRQQLFAEASAGEAIDQVDQPVDDKEPHACEVPVEAPGCPIAKPPEGTEIEPTNDYVIIVDAPTRRDHHQHDHGVDPVHDPEGPRVQATPHTHRRCLDG